MQERTRDKISVSGIKMSNEVLTILISAELGEGFMWKLKRTDCGLHEGVFGASVSLILINASGGDVQEKHTMFSEFNLAVFSDIFVDEQNS